MRVKITNIQDITNVWGWNLIKYLIYADSHIHFQYMMLVELSEILIKDIIAQYNLISSHPTGQVWLEKGRIGLVLRQFQP